MASIFENGNSQAITRATRRALYTARWLVILTVLASAQLPFPSVIDHRYSITILVASIAILTLVFQLVPEQKSLQRNYSFVIAADVLLISVIVLLTRGISSPLYPLYFLVIIEAATGYGVRGGMIWAGIIGIMSMGVVLATGRSINEMLVLEDLLRTIPYLFLIAYITGALRDRIQLLARAEAALRSEQKTVEKEMALARTVQMAQLPMEIPNVEGLGIGVWYRPARQVGGDFYDFFPIESDQLGVTVADVAGSGVPAALLVSTVKYSMRQYQSDDREAMMRVVNHNICQVISSESFVTSLYGVLDSASGDFRYVNAGHMPPIVVKAETNETIVYYDADPPLGIFETSQYTERMIHLDHGDTMILYSDGVTDALARNLEGIDRFRVLLRELDGSKMESWGDEILSRITEPVHVDDITIVAIQRR